MCKEHPKNVAKLVLAECEEITSHILTQRICKNRKRNLIWNLPSDISHHAILNFLLVLMYIIILNFTGQNLDTEILIFSTFYLGDLLFRFQRQ